MAIKRLKRDPRSAQQRAADEEVLALVEARQFLNVPARREAKAIAGVEAAYSARRNLVAALGTELGAIRRRRGISQEELANRVGTKKSNISRIESGRYGGLSFERFLAIVQALGGLPIEALGRTTRPGLVWWLRRVARGRVVPRPGRPSARVPRSRSRP